MNIIQQIKSLPEDYWTKWRFFTYGFIFSLLIDYALAPDFISPHRYVESIKPIAYQDNMPHVLELKRLNGTKTSLYILDRGIYIPLEDFKQKKIDSLESANKKMVDSLESRMNNWY